MFDYNDPINALNFCLKHHSTGRYYAAIFVRKDKSHDIITVPTFNNALIWNESGTICDEDFKIIETLQTQGFIKTYLQEVIS